MFAAKRKRSDSIGWSPFWHWHIIGTRICSHCAQHPRYIWPASPQKNQANRCGSREPCALVRGMSGLAETWTWKNYEKNAKILGQIGLPGSWCLWQLEHGTRPSEALKIHDTFHSKNCTSITIFNQTDLRWWWWRNNSRFSTQKLELDPEC